MRTIHSDLLAAQRSSSVTPYMRINFTVSFGGTGYVFTTTDTPNRIYSVNHVEEPYGGVASIKLKNHDSYFNNLDLRGYKVYIGWGAITASGPRYSEPANLYVLSQREISEEGQLLTEFVCVDVWYFLDQAHLFTGGTTLKGTVTIKNEQERSKVIGTRITASNGAVGIIHDLSYNYIHITRPEGTTPEFQANTKASNEYVEIDIQAVESVGSGGLAPTYSSGTDGYTIQAILRAVCSPIVPIDRWTVDSDDPPGNFQNLKTGYVAELGNTVKDCIVELMSYTGCVIRNRTDGFHVMYLNPDASVDYEYDSNHVFYSESRDKTIVIPSGYIVVNQDSRNSEGDIIVGAYQHNYQYYNTLGFTINKIFPAYDVTSNTMANTRAQYLANKAVFDAHQGEVIVPIMNFGQELFDKIRIIDFRNNNIQVTGIVGRIQRTFIAGEYSMKLRLGGVSTSATVQTETLDIISAPVPRLPKQTEERNEHITAAQITATRFDAIPSSLLDGHLSSFEDWPNSPGIPRGWELGNGSANNWVRCDTNPIKAGTLYARCSGVGSHQAIRWNRPIYVSPYDIIGISLYIARDGNANGGVMVGFDAFKKDGSYIGTYAPTFNNSEFPEQSEWYRKEINVVCPANTHYIKIVLIVTDTCDTGYWYFDDVFAYRASQMIVWGDDPDERITIGPDPANPESPAIILRGGDVDSNPRFRMFTSDGNERLILGGSSAGGWIIGKPKLWTKALQVQRFFPRIISQSQEPESGDGNNQISIGELAIWVDTGNGYVYLIFNDYGNVKRIQF